MDQIINRKGRKDRQELDLLSKKIIDAAICVHSQLGPGLLEHVYQKCLYFELSKRGIHADSEVYLPIVYDSHIIDNGYRVDLLVENSVILELKSVIKLEKIHTAQLITYLKLSKKKLGFLLNFNESRLSNGIQRLVNGF